MIKSMTGPALLRTLELSGWCMSFCSTATYERSRSISHPAFLAFKFITAVFFSLFLTACAPQQPIDDDGKVLSGNSFYDVYQVFDTLGAPSNIQPFAGVLYFADNGELRGIEQGNGNSVLEGRWRAFARNGDSRIAGVSLNSLVLYTHIDGFRNEAAARSVNIEITDGRLIAMVGGHSSKAVRGFPKQADYDAQLRKIKSAKIAPPAPKPAPAKRPIRAPKKSSDSTSGEGAALLGEAVIMIPICILSSFVLCL